MSIQNQFNYSARIVAPPSSQTSYEGADAANVTIGDRSLNIARGDGKANLNVDFTGLNGQPTLYQQDGLIAFSTGFDGNGQAKVFAEEFEDNGKGTITGSDGREYTMSALRNGASGGNVLFQTGENEFYQVNLSNGYQGERVQKWTGPVPPTNRIEQADNAIQVSRKEICPPPPACVDYPFRPVSTTRRHRASTSRPPIILGDTGTTIVSTSTFPAFPHNRFHPATKSIS